MSSDIEKAKKRKKTKDSEPGEMNFWGHLEELRKRIIWAMTGLILGCVVSGIFIDFLIESVLLQPASAANLDLQNLRPFGQPFLYFKIILVSGLIISFPFMIMQLWRFITPGLYDNERVWVRKISVFTTFSFLLGVAFAYFVMIPSMLSFAASFGTKEIKNIIDINEYFSFITMIILAAGILFEMPMISYVLSRIGLLTPKTMRKYRRHSVVAILILAAVLTPTPDPISQMIFAAPLFILYEISIIISRAASRKFNTGDTL